MFLFRMFLREEVVDLATFPFQSNRLVPRSATLENPTFGSVEIRTQGCWGEKHEHYLRAMPPLFGCCSVGNSMW